MYIFYSPDILDNKLYLSEEESKHCVKVLRHKTSDVIQLMDGSGGMYKAEITEANPSKTLFTILEHTKVASRIFYLHIAIAPTKNISRFEWFLEKATELGIDEVTPLICENSERKILKQQRFGKILLSASKQSKQAFIPEMNPIVSFQDFIAVDTFQGEKYIAHCQQYIPEILKNEPLKEKKVIVLIGPEGDFSPNEIKMAKSKGFKEISLGESRLRTETAGLAACFAVHFINQ